MEQENEEIHTFEQLNLTPELLQGIASVGYKEPSPIQAQAIPVVLEGRDVIGCAQTGTGKTAAFVLPILQMLKVGAGLQALVLTPTRELALQIENCIQGLNKFAGIRSAVVYGGVGIQSQEEKLRLGVEFLVATPGRLLDHIWRGNIDFPTLRLLVLDEADRMLDMGFLPDIKKIITEFLPRDRQTLLFSATISPEINRLARFALHEPVTIQVGKVKPAEGVTHGVFMVRQEEKQRVLVRLLRDVQAEDPVIIFTRSKIGAERLATSLHRSGFDVTALHSDRNQTQRERALQGFRDRRYQVMVATDVASRGLDIEGVALIINYDVPMFAEDYVHRVGRTARAAAKGAAYTLATSSEERNLRSIEKFIGQPLPHLEAPNIGSQPRRPGRDHTPRPAVAHRPATQETVTHREPAREEAAARPEAPTVALGPGRHPEGIVPRPEQEPIREIVTPRRREAHDEASAPRRHQQPPHEAPALRRVHPAEHEAAHRSGHREPVDDAAPPRRPREAAHEAVEPRRRREDARDDVAARGHRASPRTDEGQERQQESGREGGGRRRRRGGGRDADRRQREQAERLGAESTQAPRPQTAAHPARPAAPARAESPPHGRGGGQRGSGSAQRPAGERQEQGQKSAQRQAEGGGRGQQRHRNENRPVAAGSGGKGKRRSPRDQGHDDAPRRIYDNRPIVTYQDRTDPSRRRWQQSPNPIIEDAHSSEKGW